MRHRMLVCAATVVALCLANTVHASCPKGFPNEIFCDDFDSYCTTGGPPGNPNCPEGSSKSNSILQSVWYNTSPGTSMVVEDAKAAVIYDVYSGRYASKIDLGQQTVRDWVASPPVDEPGQVLDFTRRIAELHGSQYAAFAGSDSEPLTLTFTFGAVDGKFWTSSYLMELAFGSHENPLNHANTDFVIWPKSACCNGMVLAGPWPLVCAQGNPFIGMPPETGCPDISLLPPPIHNAIAIGSLPIMDTDPCHCLSAHAPQSYNLTFFDGQLWWALRTDSIPPGATLSGEGPLPIGNAPATPPANYPAGAEAGNFYLSSPRVDRTIPPPAGKNYPVYRPYNTVTLTILRDTARIQLASIIPASEVDPENPSAGLYYTYYLTSVLDNVPLKYAGPFDRLRSGVAPGCELVSNSDWSTCSSIAGRQPLATPDGFAVTVDRVFLYGGVGYSVEGACCDAADGACTIELEADCLTHGRWTRSSQTCQDTICCPRIYGDDDHDGSVDMNDFAALQRCITTGGGNISPGCACFDFDGSNSINSNDIQRFVNCAGGASIPGDSSPGCQGRGW